MNDDSLFYLLIFFLSLPGLLIASLLCLSYLTPWPRRNRAHFTSKREIFTPSASSKSTEVKHFPSLLISDDDIKLTSFRTTKPQVYLTVVVPAMNEEDRLPLMLDECLEYLEKRKKAESTFTYEVIVVDDGSRDGTTKVAFEYSKTYPVYIHSLQANFGKGGAVREGVLCARGQLILFADADGATTFSEFAKLEKEIYKLCNGQQSSASEPLDWTHPAMVVGSRAHLEKDSISKRSLLRTILMIGFHSVVYVFAVRSVRDTQCGFKLFSRAAAAKLFPRIHIERWAFDVELLYLAEALKFSISEVSVRWTEIDGSKITPFFSWLQMGRDIVLIWFRYLLKVWKVNEVVE